ncbi:hypothetical protein ACOWLW_00770 [Helicobacter pylori]
MRLVVFFNGFNLWLLAYYKHAINTNHTITEPVCAAIKRLDKNNEK